MISVIVPIYNVEAYVAECFDSLLAQTYKDFEVIVVDDCGTDGSMQIVERYVDKLPIRIVRHTKNKGLSVARNTGIDAAMGDYIYFLDSDDSIVPQCLEWLIEDADEYDCVTANFCYIEHPEMQLHIPNQILHGTDDVTKCYKRGWYAMAWNVLIHRDFLLQHQLLFKEGLLHEDELWTFQLACVVQNMRILSAITYNYRLRQNSIVTSTHIERLWNSKVEVLKLRIETISIHHLEQNEWLCNIIEDSKRHLLQEAIQKLPSVNKYSYYALFRQLRCQYTIYCFGRDVHYLLPMPIGYCYMLAMCRLSIFKRQLSQYFSH